MTTECARRGGSSMARHASALIELMQRRTVPPVQFTEEDEEPF